MMNYACALSQSELGKYYEKNSNLSLSKNENMFYEKKKQNKT